jgi:hypothetical protein
MITKEDKIKIEKKLKDKISKLNKGKTVKK